MRKFIVFQGRKYRLSGPYYKADRWGDGPSSLHRARWEHWRGPIPDGFDVHHKDGDGTNNRLSNLELRERGEHRREHILEKIAAGVLKPPNAVALAKAAEWHASSEGLKWHARNGKAAWKNRVWHKLICQECGREYRSPYPNKSKFCHLNCKMTALRRRRGRPVGVRSRKHIRLRKRQKP